MSIEIKKEKFIKELKSKLNQKCYGNTSEETVLIRAFKYFDLDNTGFSDYDSFLNTVRKIGITSLNDEEIAEIFSLYDEEKKGEIDYREFVSELFGNKSLSKKNKSSQIELEESAQKNEIKPEMEEKNENLKEYTPEEILNIMREKLNERGVQGICSIARNFRIVDENNSQTIDFFEFKQVCNMFNFGLNDTQLKNIFDNFDTENTGEIDYDEFIRTIRGEMNEFRQNLVQKVFEKLDIKKTGEISFKELNSNYNFKNHPDVLSGKISEEEALKEFMDTFQETYNYLCGTETNDIITIEEFMEYYENVSMTIEEDEYFEYLLNNTWNLGLNVKYKIENKPKQIEENIEEKNIEQLNEEIEAKNERALIKFINEVKNLGTTSLISLMRLFKLNDINNTKELEFYAFSKSLHEFETELTDEEISDLFNYFDKDNTKLINYNNFINAIRGPMNQRRMLIVKEAFKKLDIDKGGIVELAEIKLQFNSKNNKEVKSGEKTEEEVYTEFVDTFQMNHDNRVGPRNKRVTFDEFLDYYNYVSMGIDDDSYFINLIQNSWKLNPYYQINQDQQTPTNNFNEITYNYRNIKNKKIRIGAAAAPFGTDMTPNTEDKRPSIYQQELIQDNIIQTSPIEKFRTVLKKRGVRGIMAMRRAFMIADENDSKTLTLPEFIKFCHDYRIPISGNEIKEIFGEFDTNRNGEMNYEEFISSFVGEMCERRKRLITILFETFDKDRKGFVDLDEIRNSFSPINHPDVVTGKKTEDEILAEFLDNLQYHFSLLKSEKEQENNQINLDEFLAFFNYISAGIEDDDYFEDVIKSGFNLEERKPKKKGWKSIV